jgi:NodT family efflux transporter outer membrane factor (OMF) lipoprotein
MNLSVRFSSIRRVQHLLARAIVCATLLVLSSCAIPKLRQAEPAPPLPESFNGVASPDNSALLSIQEFYNDATLTHLIGQALAGNRELKILDEEVQVARSEILARQAAYLPFVTVGANAGLDKPSLYTPLGAAEDQLLTPQGKHFHDPLGDFRLGLNLFWQLDIWRELRNARDAAGQRYIAAIERRNYFVTRLVAEVAENYYTLMSLDKRLETLDQTIQLQDDGYKIAKAKFENAKGTELAVQRFLAEVRKAQSEKWIVSQEIVKVENRTNFLLNRYPQHVERQSAGFLDLELNRLSLGVPAHLLQFRPDIRQAERELEAAGLDIKVAKAHFFPRLDITAGVGYEAFNPRFLFTPDALVYNVAGNLVAPLLNKKAIQAEYLSANARQLASVYNYQRVILDAFTEVINRMAKVENYGQSIAIKKQQLAALDASVKAANNLFLNARAEYVEVLLAQRDLQDARTVLIETKKEQLAAIVNLYQALGGGLPPGLRDGSGACQGAPPELPPPLDPAPGILQRIGSIFSPAPVLMPPPPAAPAPAVLAPPRSLPSADPVTR